GASFYVAEVLWDDTAAGMDVLRYGWLGRVKEIGGKFLAELVGLTAPLQQPILETYSVACRATLGDARCGVDLAPWTISGVVTSSASHRVFDASGLSVPADDPDHFVYGKVTWTTGANAGLSMEVEACDGTTTTLLLPMP